MRDHYHQEGLCQNALVTELLAKKVGLLEEEANLERATCTAKEAHLNYKEIYEIVEKETSKPVKAQKALERVITHMEAEQLPLKLKNAELAHALKEKEAKKEVLERNLQSLQEDR